MPITRRGGGIRRSGASGGYANLGRCEYGAAGGGDPARVGGQDRSGCAASAFAFSRGGPERAHRRGLQRSSRSRPDLGCDAGDRGGARSGCVADGKRSGTIRKHGATLRARKPEGRAGWVPDLLGGPTADGETKSVGEPNGVKGKGTRRGLRALRCARGRGGIADSG